jgi:hypothetical protein
VAIARLFAPAEPAIRGVLTVAAGSTLMAMYALGRAAALSRAWALAGPVVLGASPLFLYVAVQPLSDVLATFWSLLVVLFAFHGRRVPRSAALAGASLGIATLVRPTNALLAAPMVAALPGTRLHLLAAIAGGLPFAAWMLFYQDWAFGHPLRSGYGDVPTAFSVAHVWSSLQHYARWIPGLTGWIILLIPAAGWTWRGEHARWRVVATCWAGVVFGVYAFYYHTSEAWWYLRFVLPALPPLIVAALAGAQALVDAATTRLSPVLRTAATTASIVLIASGALWGLGTHQVAEEYRQVKHDELAYREAARLVARHASEQRPAIVGQLSGAVNYYAPRVPLLRVDRIRDVEWTAIREWQARRQQVLTAALTADEAQPLLHPGQGRLRCEWKPSGRFRRVTFWECPPP